MKHSGEIKKQQDSRTEMAGKKPFVALEWIL